MMKSEEQSSQVNSASGPEDAAVGTTAFREGEQCYADMKLVYRLKMLPRKSINRPAGRFVGDRQ